MSNIVSFSDYRKAKGIPPVRSPYYTTKASPRQINQAAEQATKYLHKPHDVSGNYPYAVVIGYEDKKTHQVRLLKSVCIYPTKQVFFNAAGLKNANVVAVIRE